MFGLCLCFLVGVVIWLCLLGCLFVYVRLVGLCHFDCLLLVIRCDVLLWVWDCWCVGGVGYAVCGGLLGLGVCLLVCCFV